MNKPNSRILAINLALVLLIGGAGFWGYTLLHPATIPVATSTAKVTRGDVMATVSATGKVISPSDIGLVPLVAGTLKALYVKVGQHVSIGQKLAQVDTTNLITALTSAKASLVSAKAAVAGLVPTKTAAESAQAALQLSQAQAALAQAKQNQIDNTNLTNTNAASYAQTVYLASKAYNDFLANFSPSAATAQASVVSAQTALSNSQINYDNFLTTLTTGTYTADPVTYCQTSTNFNPDTSPTIQGNCKTLLSNLQNLNSSTAALAQARLNQTVNNQKDSQTLQGLNVAYQNALTSQQNNLLKDAQTIAGYATSVQSAQNSMDNLIASTNVAMQPSKQSAIDTAQAQLSNASAVYNQAKRNLDSATIVAPANGDIATISTIVGGNVSTTSTPVSSTANATGFIVLTNVGGLQITGSFSEADAAKIQAGQPATFTFDALPNATNVTGKVLGVDLLPTTSGGVTSYSATFTLDAPVPGLKSGMTATPTVQVGLATGVIQVTAQAVTSRGQRSTVNVVTTVGGKQVLTPTRIIIGLKGDSSDEVQSGLKVGDIVALPSVKASTGTNGFPGGGIPGAGGGFGGGGIGGGGIGGGVGRTGG